MYRKRYYKKNKNIDRIKIVEGKYLIGDTVNNKKITSLGKTWIENGFSVQYAYFTKQKNRINYTTFSDKVTIFQNSRGRCEDAPCCGCCS